MSKLVHNDEQIEKSQDFENDQDDARYVEDHFVEIVTSESWPIWGAIRIRFNPLTLQRSSSLRRAPIGRPAISHRDRDAQRTRARSLPAQLFARFGGNSSVSREKLRPQFHWPRSKQREMYRPFHRRAGPGRAQGNHHNAAAQTSVPPVFQSRAAAANLARDPAR